MLELNLNLNLNSAEEVKKEAVALTPDPAVIYDLLIIGAGPAGLNAALYAKRKGRNVAVIGERLGGQLLDSSTVENYLGTDRLEGHELAARFVRNVRDLSVPMLEGFKVTGYEQDDQIFSLQLSDNKSYRSRALILATGSRPRRLGVPGEAELSGKGVAFCAICDGPLFSGKRHIVAGGGNAAIEAATGLARIASEVTVVQRSTFRADPILMDEIRRQENVTLLEQTDLLSINGEAKVESITVRDKMRGEEREIPAEAVFVEIGHNPNLGPFAGKLAVNGRGEVEVDAQNMTSIPGLFAAGDVTGTPFKQIIIAAAEGAKAALSASIWLDVRPAGL